MQSLEEVPLPTADKDAALQRLAAELTTRRSLLRHPSRQLRHLQESHYGSMWVCKRKEEDSPKTDLASMVSGIECQANQASATNDECQSFLSYIYKGIYS